MKNNIIKFKKFKKIETRITSGIVFIYNNKILLLHPSNEKWDKTFSYPKGHIDKNESIRNAAIRETYEEVGIKIPSYYLNDNNLYRMVNQDKEFNGVIKIDYYFVVKLREYDFLKLFNGNIILDRKKLQKEEADWAGFLDKYQCYEKLKPRLNRIIDHLK